MKNLLKKLKKKETENFKIDESIWRSIKKKKEGKQKNLRGLWNTIKCSNIGIMGVQKGEEREKKRGGDRKNI